MKTNDIFGILRKFWVRNMCFLCKNIDFKIGLFLSNLDLISVKNKLWWIHRVKCPSLLISRCKMTQKTYVTRHACDLYFVVSLCDLILTFSGMTFVLTHYHSQTFTSTLCEFELFAARLTALRCPAQLTLNSISSSSAHAQLKRLSSHVAELTLS